MDLINYKWPVKKGSLALCYYFGFWLPAALVGKYAGIIVGYIFQIIWATIGISLAILLLWKYLNCAKLRFVFVFIFYSGLDVIIYILKNILQGKTNPVGWILNLLRGQHIELSAMFFNSSSNMTLLFWLYNQAIPFWLGMLLLLLQRNNKTRAGVYLLMVLYAPFPFIALAPLAIFYMLKDIRWNGNISDILHDILSCFSLGNIGVVPFALITILFYKSNIAVGKLGFISVNKLTVLMFIAYIFCEYGCYLICLGRQVVSKDKTLQLLLIVTFGCSIITLGNSYDFAWRTCIPLSFYIMLLVMEKIKKWEWSDYSYRILLIVFCLGLVTPTTEMMRTIRNEKTVICGYQNARSDSLESVFIRENNECYDNFIASTESFFFEHFAK